METPYVNLENFCSIDVLGVIDDYIIYNAAMDKSIPIKWVVLFNISSYT